MSLEDLPTPPTCPTCGADWSSTIGGPHGSGVLNRICVNEHRHEFPLTPEEVLRAELILRPWMLGRPAVFYGGPLDGQSETNEWLQRYEIGQLYSGGVTRSDGSTSRFTYRLRASTPEALEFDYVDDS